MNCAWVEYKRDILVSFYHHYPQKWLRWHTLLYPKYIVGAIEGSGDRSVNIFAPSRRKNQLLE